MKRFLSNTIVILMAAAAMISCKESETVDPTVTLSDQTVTMTQKDTYQLTAELSDYSHDYVVWASNNSEVASVSQEGLVTAIAPGTAEITAKCEYGKNRQTCTVTVNPIYVTAISLDKTSIKKTEGQNDKLTVTFTPADATYKTVTWTSSDENVVKVKDGAITCVGAGTAVITVTTGKGVTSGSPLTATCTVDVKKSQNFISWQNDNAGSKTMDIFADPATSKAGIITFDGAKISWTANETGKPRIDSLTLSNGSRIVITQFEEKDIIGDYTFVSKIFCKGGLVPANNTGKLDVKFEIDNFAECPQDVDGSVHVNGIKITGIYGTMVMPASFEFNYDSKTARLGLFLDARDGVGQAIDNKYYIFTPGLCTQTSSAWGGKYIFNEVELGTPDYTWWWFDFDVENCTFTRVNRTAGSGIPMQELTQYSTDQTTAKWISSIDVVASDSNVFDHTTVVPDYKSNGGYLNVFQINPAGYSGICFIRK